MTTTRARLRLLLPLAAVAGMLALASSAGADGLYTDAAGDGKGAPDIQNVVVSTDVNSQIRIRVNVDNLPSPSAVQTLVLLDTDVNPATGDPGMLGADYFFVVDETDNTYGFGHWNGADWEAAASSSTVVVQSNSRGVTISINRSELGDTGGFNFWAATSNGDPGSGQWDNAPDNGTWSYTVAANGPDIQGVVTRATPAAPKAGKLFTVAPTGLRLGPAGGTATALPKPESYSCTARLGGKALAGKGAGGCSWKLPKKVRGKRLAVVLTVMYQGASKSVQLAYRVK